MTTISPIEDRPYWRKKPLIFWNCLAVFLLTSLLFPPTAAIWKIIDEAFFSFVNQLLELSSFQRTFWALANHRFADWIEDLFILGFYLVALYKMPKGDRKQKGLEFVFCVLLIAMTILLVDRVLCRDILRLRRQSPTLILPSAIHLSDFLTWIEVKTQTTKSFPGDHATTALMFACSYAYLMRGKLGILALFYGAFLCLPRLVVGAHWLSDIVVGSGCIAIFSLSWAFCSPLAQVFLKRFSLSKSS